MIIRLFNAVQLHDSLIHSRISFPCVLKLLLEEEFQKFCKKNPLPTKLNKPQLEIINIQRLGCLLYPKKSTKRYSAKRTLDYFEGNFDAFRSARRISSDEEAEAILLGRHNFDNDVDLEERRNAPVGVVAGFLVWWFETHTNKRKMREA